MNTKNLILIPHVPAHLLALLESEHAYEKISGMRVAKGVREHLLAGSAEFVMQLRAATAPDPWRFGFAILHKIDNPEIIGARADFRSRVIGLCAFTGPPDAKGVAEIAYGIAPAYQGKGYATEAAAALAEFASHDDRVTTICAHTLRETNASTRVLEKCDFKKTGEIVDSENNFVWRWERSVRQAQLTKRTL